VPATPEALRAALGALVVTIDEAGANVRAVDLPSYPGGPRPSSVISLRGAGAVGRGEHVAWTAAAHVACRDRTLPRIPCGRWELAAWSAVLATVADGPYERAALEAAAIDLALRQHGLTLFRLAGQAPRAVRYVVSFGQVADPAAEARSQGDVELKVDADPSWSDATFDALARAGRIAVLDWKNGGGRTDHERAHRMLPDALVEDPCWEAAPWSNGVARRLAADARLTAATEIHRLPVRPAAANIKPARMGGVLEALAGAAACQELGIAVYLGGMFEVDVGRRQLQALAALLCPDGPNDVAPIGCAGETPDRPAQIRVDPDTAGFGA
jgi:L-alanine-DL-glutamate epimerase-like enolase superfamily enzyme